MKKNTIIVAMHINECFHVEGRSVIVLTFNAHESGLLSYLETIPDQGLSIIILDVANKDLNPTLKKDDVWMLAVHMLEKKAILFYIDANEIMSHITNARELENWVDFLVGKNEEIKAPIVFATNDLEDRWLARNIFKKIRHLSQFYILEGFENAFNKVIAISKEPLPTIESKEELA